MEAFYGKALDPERADMFQRLPDTNASTLGYIDCFVALMDLEDTQKLLDPMSKIRLNLLAFMHAHSIVEAGYHASQGDSIAQIDVAVRLITGPGGSMQETANYWLKHVIDSPTADIKFKAIAHSLLCFSIVQRLDENPTTTDLMLAMDHAQNAIKLGRTPQIALTLADHLKDRVIWKNYPEFWTAIEKSDELRDIMEVEALAESRRREHAQKNPVSTKEIEVCSFRPQFYHCFSKCDNKMCQGGRKKTEVLKECTGTCSGHNKMYYCSMDCQRQHWRHGHRKICQPPTKEDQDSAAAPEMLTPEEVLLREQAAFKAGEELLANWSKEDSKKSFLPKMKEKAKRKKSKPKVTKVATKAESTFSKVKEPCVAIPTCIKTRQFVDFLPLSIDVAVSDPTPFTVDVDACEMDSDTASIDSSPICDSPTDDQGETFTSAAEMSETEKADSIDNFFESQQDVVAWQANVHGDSETFIGQSTVISAKSSELDEGIQTPPESPAQIITFGSLIYPIKNGTISHCDVYIVADDFQLL